MHSKTKIGAFVAALMVVGCASAPDTSGDGIPSIRDERVVRDAAFMMCREAIMADLETAELFLEAKKIEGRKISRYNALKQISDTGAKEYRTQFLNTFFDEQRQTSSLGSSMLVDFESNLKRWQRNNQKIATYDKDSGLFFVFWTSGPGLLGEFEDRMNIGGREKVVEFVAGLKPIEPLKISARHRNSVHYGVEMDAPTAFKLLTTEKNHLRFELEARGCEQTKPTGWRRNPTFLVSFELRNISIYAGKPSEAELLWSWSE